MLPISSNCKVLEIQAGKEFQFPAAPLSGRPFRRHDRTRTDAECHVLPCAPNAHWMVYFAPMPPGGPPVRKSRCHQAVSGVRMGLGRKQMTVRWLLPFLSGIYGSIPHPPSDQRHVWSLQHFQWRPKKTRRRPTAKHAPHRGTAGPHNAAGPRCTTSFLLCVVSLYYSLHQCMTHHITGREVRR